MNTLLITPKSKLQEAQFRALADKLGLAVRQLSPEDKEDAALLQALQAVEDDKRNVSLGTFLRKLSS